MLTAVGCAGVVFAAAAILRWFGTTPARPAPSPALSGGQAAQGALRRIGALGGRLEAQRRRETLVWIWPAVADELAATLRTGSSLHQALSSVAARGGAAGEVVRELLGPVDRGQALADAAEAWTRRARSPDETLLAEAVQLAAWTGRPEPLLFDTVADSLRERLALAGELRAQTAQARTSAAVLVVLPLGFTVLVGITDRHASHFLFGTEGGWVCATLGLALDALGAWWMHTAIRGAGP
jgi:tight adherence protein B